MDTQGEIDGQLAYIDEDRSKALIVSHTVCLALAGIAIVLRLIARRMSKAAIKADDYLIIVAFVSCLFRSIEWPVEPSSRSSYGITFTGGAHWDWKNEPCFSLLGKMRLT